MLASTSVRNASDSTDLKAVFAEKFPVHGEEVKAFRRAHGDKKVGEITVDMVSGVKAPSQPILASILPSN